jgi:hypothetical protein
VTKGWDVIALLLVVAAAALGLWLGMAGADVSPIFTEAPFGGVGGPGR